jgi:hypothetical protein
MKSLLVKIGLSILAAESVVKFLKDLSKVLSAK